MPIRFSKSGSTLRFGATALVASASLWFGTAVYSQTQQHAVEIDSAPPSSQTLQDIFDERDHRFSQLPSANKPSGSRRLQAQQFSSDRLSNSSISGDSNRELLPACGGSE